MCDGNQSTSNGATQDQGACQALPPEQVDPEDGSGTIDACGIRNACDADDGSASGAVCSDSGGDAGSVARGSQNANVIKPTPDPIIDPPIRLFCQYGGTWGSKSLRPPNMMNGPYGPKEDKSEGSPNNWSDNGCYPTSFAMVLRWWCEDFPATAGKAQFPTDNNKGIQAALDPLEMCRRFNGTEFFDCVLAKPLVPRCPTCNTKFSDMNTATGLCGGGCGTNLSQLTPGNCLHVGHDTYNVDGSKVQTYAAKMTLNGVNMTYQRFRCSGASDAVKAMTLKSFLSDGPIIVNMTQPGHFVVVTGYRDKQIYVCDPGMIISRTKWLGKQGQRQPVKAGCGPSFGGDSDKRGYVTIPDDQQNSKKRTWLSVVIALDKLTFPGSAPAFWPDTPDPSLVCSG